MPDDFGADLAATLDPTRLTRRAGLDPDDWQREVLRSRAGRLLLNCCRQSGKSTTVAALAAHTALYDPGLVIMLSPTERQSRELFRKVLDIWRALGRPVAAEAENTLALELVNGGRLVALPGNEATVRGYSGAKLLIVDEAARVPDPLFHAVTPMLAVSGGRLVALSTPAGKRGWWHQAWIGEGGAWARWEVPAARCPRIGASFLAEERAALPRQIFAQEYECQFVEASDQVFAYDDIAAMFDTDAQATPALFPLGGAVVPADAPPDVERIFVR
jgi:hypothetical protein